MSTQRHRFAHSAPRLPDEAFGGNDNANTGGSTCVLCGSWFSSMRTHDFENAVCFGTDDAAREAYTARAHLWANAAFNARHGAPFHLSEAEEKLTHPPFST